MNKKAALITAGVLLLGGTGGFLYWDNAYNFTGDTPNPEYGYSKTTTRDTYYANFSIFNGEDTFELEMNKGDRIHLDAHIDKGKASVSFASDGSDTGEVISNIEDADTYFTAEEDGRYVVKVSAKHARGVIELKCVDLPEGKSILVVK
ncbi:MAG TPA: hypothetical protein DCG30_00460 [Ruminococcus sp.]|nr:hypothetical protein [Ruminococcus sp.]HBB72524.1 hypothetical protein [Ruminococcus sp.]